MARVEIALNGRSYAVGCEDGQEARLREIVSLVDSRMRALAVGKSAVSEPQLLVLTMLTLADQMFDLRAELAKTKTKANGAQEASGTLDPALEEKYASAVESLAARIDSVASRLARV